MADELFKGCNGQLEPLLHFGRIAVHANKSAPVEGGREELADAIGPLLVGHGDSQALGLVFDLLLKHELLQDLLGVEGFKGLGHLVALLNFGELLAHVLQGNRLIPDLRDGIRRDLASGWGLRNEVKQHAAPQDHHEGP